jgi:hypothetical protein
VVVIHEHLQTKGKFVHWGMCREVQNIFNITFAAFIREDKPL